MKSFHVFCNQPGRFILRIYKNDKYSVLLYKDIVLAEGENIINIDMFIGEDYYYAISTVNGILYGNNLLDHGVCSSREKFINNNFDLSYGFKMYFEYLNWVLPTRGDILKETNSNYIIDELVKYDTDVIYIDTVNKQISTRKILKVTNYINTYQIPVQTVDYNIEVWNEFSSRCRSIFYSVQSSALYVAFVPQNYDDILIAMFNDDKILVGKENCMFKDVRTIMIGDSYCQGYSPDGNVKSWAQDLKDQISFNDYDTVIKYKGGTGFKAKINNLDFLELLKLAEAEVGNNNHVERIIVCGGYNDASYSLNDVYSKCEEFRRYVRDNFKNATMYVGMVGYSTSQARREQLRNISLYAYQTMCSYINCKYLTNSEFSLSDNLMASDGYHPNTDGQMFICRNILQALKTRFWLYSIQSNYIIKIKILKE